ncbi:MAG TPA: single-stranded-DNA-specific exonuclease RecJ [Anaerolineaceae bacterium]|nr:single-stranded-DNA-specific exonuclease RecJ [Anaerolineaceae bacterium]HPN49970.1 single-stranded-DNA-specific exonuclease RecJ [Anaerolineaceae bacterium]
MVDTAVQAVPPRLTRRWEVSPVMPVEVDAALKEFIHPMRQILYNRGFRDAETARAFLNPALSDQADPFLLKGMPEAVARLEKAIQDGEKIAIYGDYDVDGVTATTLLVEVLRAYQADVQGYIPNRFDEGYGVNKDALATLYDRGVRLVVTVDCGARSPREADYARARGLDLIISDHHQPGEELPQVTALINPKQAGDTYPDKDLAGVGLAFKIAQAMLMNHPLNGINVGDWLDLVALGTVADLAPLQGENRAMVASGLQVIRKTRRQGLFSLAQVAGLKLEKTTAQDIGFQLGPRLNAAGRLESALAALDLLLERDAQRAGELAQKLDVQNTERQALTREIQEKASKIASAEGKESLLLFAADESFNEGVVGLAASRLVDQFYRPAIVCHHGEEFTRGSCRSIPEFHITEALDQCADLMVRHGGHRAAAGFTLRNENVPALVARLQQIAAAQLTGLDLRPSLKADLELPLARLDGAKLFMLIDELDRLQPVGLGNPEPLFVSYNLQVRGARRVGRDGSHLKLTVSAQNITYDAIAFRLGHWADDKPEWVDLIYALEINEFNGRRSIQLNVRDLRPSGGNP